MLRTQKAATHLVYLPGLGGGYDVARRHALRKWQRRNLTVSFVPMHWTDRTETYDQKLARINKVIDQKPHARTVLVGESAGGAVAVAVSCERADIAKVITICGKNVRADRVAGQVYERNPAFRQALHQADACAKKLCPGSDRPTYVTYYSKFDSTIRRIDTELPTGTLRVLPTLGHIASIFAVLFPLRSVIIKEALK